LASIFGGDRPDFQNPDRPVIKLIDIANFENVRMGRLDPLPHRRGAAAKGWRGAWCIDLDQSMLLCSDHPPAASGVLL
jgi:hypothetical protein